MISGILVCFYWLITFTDTILVISAAFREAKKNGKGPPALSEKMLLLEWLFLAQRGGIIVSQLIIGPVVEKASFSDTLFVVIGAELFGHGIGAAFLLCDFLLLYLTRISRGAIQRELHNEKGDTTLISESNTVEKLHAMNRHHVKSLKPVVYFDCATAFVLGVLYSFVPETAKDTALVILLVFLFCVSPSMLILSVYYRKRS